MNKSATRRFPVSIRFYWLLVLLLAGIFLASFHLSKGDQAVRPAASDVDWPEYNGGSDRNHFSALTQIDTQNIGRLEKVWEYNSAGADTATNQTQIQCNAIIIDGVLYGVSAGSQAFALNAATGRELWKTAFTDETFAMTSRGVTYWTDGTDKRIFFAYGHWLYSLDATTGKPVPTFGQAGKVSLREGLSRPGADEYLISNTPGVISERMKEPAIHQLLSKGRGMMPAFTHFSETERKAIVDFLSGKINQQSSQPAQQSALSWVPYVHTVYNRWYDRNGYPVNKPSWGTLTAINLHTGKRRWQVPLGEYPALIEKGIPPTGTDNYGGPLVTANGLVFIAATPDQKFRVFEAVNGRLRWETKLPAAGYASPSIYSVKGRQYVVIACGGGKLRSKSGGYYVAFALKE